VRLAGVLAALSGNVQPRACPPPTPHVGFLSDHTLAEYVRIQAQNVISLSETGEPETVPVVDPR